MQHTLDRVMVYLKQESGRGGFANSAIRFGQSTRQYFNAI